MIMLVRPKDKTVKTKMATYGGDDSQTTLIGTASSRNTRYIKSRMASEPIANNADAVMEVRSCKGGREIQKTGNSDQARQCHKTWQKNRTRGEIREVEHVRVQTWGGSSGLARATVTQMYRSRLQDRHV